ncbi:MAG: CDP-alcohol phosphatidyltransferase family protein [Patescibacteria group bacterium]|jgi:CDP-diacylglycerol--glycerol-3-phosphate 3-phosphatidyltransferase
MELFKPKLQPHDKIMKYTVLLLIPKFLRPNHFTYLRFVFTPLVIYFILVSDYRAALVSFLLVAFTDAIDGSLARTRDQITERGTVLDPIADKILISSTIFVLMLKHINVFISLAIIILESLFLVGWYLRHKYGKKEKVNVWGKIKMILQVAGVAILLLGLCTGNPMMFYYSQTTLIFAIIFALISLFSYGI